MNTFSSLWCSRVHVVVTDLDGCDISILGNVIQSADYIFPLVLLLFSKEIVDVRR